MEIPYAPVDGNVLPTSPHHEQLKSFAATFLDLICFSHLRWHFVTQRPQHLLRRAAHDRRVFYWEEPIWHPLTEPWQIGEILPDLEPDEPERSKRQISLEVLHEEPLLWILRPHLTEGVDSDVSQRQLLDAFLAKRSINNMVAWYYTPMALGFSKHIQSEVTVYDCMDELTGFLGAPPQLRQLEQELFKQADVVFTGGLSLYEEKSKQHPNVHAFPSSIDQGHFESAATPSSAEPQDQASIPHPRAGFYGVIDERFDVELIAKIAQLRPAIHFVILGPVVKISLDSLPKADNIHYLGAKSYNELPAYLSAWDVALLPFAMNDSTRFISPTKTPEYLAAGKPIVSTPIRDVVRTYGEAGLVAIADTPASFAEALDDALKPPTSEWRSKVKLSLDATSWDSTWRAMQQQIKEVRELRLDNNLSSKMQTSGVTEKKPQTIVANYARHSAPRSHELQFRLKSNRRTEHFDYLVVGAGFAGSVMAERLASQSGKRVLIIDKRDHIAGNAFDHYNQDGLLIHRYGPHIFHTNSESVFEYLSQFTAWRPYEHRVLSSIQQQLLPVPINLDTINRLYDLQLDAQGMRSFLLDRIITSEDLRTSEDIVLSRVGRELYELFFRNYTRKQWGLDPSELDACVAGRIPVRYDKDDRYFSDRFQAMPLNGYTEMFERMLDHPNITVRTGIDYSDAVHSYPNLKVIYTGPIDEYFNFCFGPLPYRSLEFKHETHDVALYQPAAVVNYPNDHDFTRITEFKHLTGQKHKKTSIVFEYPRSKGDPYYPIPRPENTTLYERYRELAKAETNVHFCGRLANYRYFNMDQVVAQALTTFSRMQESEQDLFDSSTALKAAIGLQPLSGLAPA